jgi:YcxB-like protein
MGSGDQPIVIVVDPNVNELVRYSLRAYMRDPVYIAIAALIAFVAVLLFVTAPVMMRDGDAVSGYAFLIMGVVIVIVLPLLFRAAIKRRLARVLGESDKSATWAFSKSGIDIRSEHISSHLEWDAIKNIKTIPEGLLLGVWGRTHLLFHRYFRSDADYNAVVELATERLGDRVKS